MLIFSLKPNLYAFFHTDHFKDFEVGGGALLFTLSVLKKIEINVLFFQIYVAYF